MAVRAGFTAPMLGRSWWLAFTCDLRRERTFTISEVGRVHDVYTASIEPSPDPVKRA